MQYNSAGSNFEQVLTTGQKLKKIRHRKAQAGATFWTANSIIRTGYNASRVQVLDRDQDGQSVIYANGYYAKWRELGVLNGFGRGVVVPPEGVLRRSVPTIQKS